MLTTAPPEKGAVQVYQSDLPASRKPKCCGSPGSAVAPALETEKAMLLPERTDRHSKLSGIPGGQTGEGVSAMVKPPPTGETGVAIAMTLVRPDGTFVCPEKSIPHASTVPSFLSAML